MRHCLCQRCRCGVHKRKAGPAVHDEGRYGGTLDCPLGGYSAIFTYDGGIVGEGMPAVASHIGHQGMLSHSLKVCRGHPCQHHKEREGIALAVCVNQFFQTSFCSQSMLAGQPLYPGSTALRTWQAFLTAAAKLD